MPARIVVATMTVALVVALASSRVEASSPQSTHLRSWLGDPGHHLHTTANGQTNVDVCSRAVAPGVAHCDAYVRADLFGKNVSPRALGEPAPPGQATSTALVGNNGAYDPAYLRSAYNVPAGGSGKTVAVVAAYDAPNAESDLAQYRSKFGLPPCTTANGCFTKVDQNGGHNYPPFNAAWAQEISLDAQMVSAICPSCDILLVEATNAQIENLGIAVSRAVALGADVVSNSYGADEWDEQELADAYFNHPGVAVVAASGDSGYGVSYPAAAPHVVAVGGTSLLQASNTGTRKAIETVWSRAGSGCSAFASKPAWQTDAGCGNKAVADVSAVADPSTGVWVYVGADGGWQIFGGTSASAPIIGALYALAGNGASTDDVSSYPYANSTALNDIVAGNNGICGGSYLCTARPGYDGPTGLGTPNGTGAFKSGRPPVLEPDFSVAATPLRSPMRPGGTAKSTVTIAPTDGFTGAVSVIAMVSPTVGLSGTLSAPSLAVGSAPGSLVLTLNANTGGTYTVTLKATAGALVRRTTFTVPVNDFGIKVTPAMATVVRGKAARFTVRLASTGSLNGPVTLSVKGLRAHSSVIYARNPAPAPGSQTITVTTSSLDARGVMTLRIRGVKGTLNHTATVRVTIR